jgi:hypothetical protein
MAKYSDIKGFTVQTLSTDTVASAIDAGSWASGGDMNTARSRGAAGGTQTANISFMGGDATRLTNAEQYNGSAWTEVGDNNTARFDVGGSGTYTNALGFGGNTPPGYSAANESWDGSSWTEVADLNTARRVITGAGVSNTAAIAFGGFTPPDTGKTETWNGSSWTEVNDLNTARRKLKGLGTTTAAIGIGGGNPGVVTNVETWNGSSWTEVADLNAASMLSGVSGTSTDATDYGGEPGTLATTEFWNGTTWTEIADLSTGRQAGTGNMQGSTSTDAIFSGGQPPYVATTEEFNAPSVFNQIQEGQLYFNSTTNTFKETLVDVPTGSFSSGGSLNTARYVIGVCGISTAAIGAGGDFYVGPPNSPSDRSGTKTESYNGTSWTEVNDMNNDVQGTYAASGTYTAALAKTNTDSPKSFIESWDGTSWTNAPDINSPRGDSSIPATGSQTATLLTGGYHNPSSPKSSDLVEQYDGSSWTEITEINSGRYANRNVGTSTDNLVFGGYTSTYAGNTEIWNGTSWTELNDLPIGRSNHAGFGVSTLAITTNGTGPNSLGAPNPTGANSSKALNFWNGTSWSSDTDDAPYKARGSGAGGPATDGIVCAGISDPNFTLTTTIEWKVDPSNKTITSS